jgi:hypothetical protein
MGEWATSRFGQAIGPEQMPDGLDVGQLFLSDAIPDAGLAIERTGYFGQGQQAGHACRARLVCMSGGDAIADEVVRRSDQAAAFAC